MYRRYRVQHYLAGCCMKTVPFVHIQDAKAFSRKRASQVPGMLYLDEYQDGQWITIESTRGVS